MKKYNRGYTTGAFDMFHVGHLNILQRAKEQCNYLIVGVSTDELIQKYKHKQTIIPFENRERIVGAIKYVDEVVSQEDRDKFKAWQKLQFDVMFVGDDWRGDTLFVEVEEMLRKVGVDVIYFPYTQGVSSTLLREKLEKDKVDLKNGEKQWKLK